MIRFDPLYMGIALWGRSLRSWPIPSPIYPDKFRQGLEGMAHHSGLEWIFTSHARREHPAARRQGDDHDPGTSLSIGVGEGDPGRVHGCRIEVATRSSDRSRGAVLAPALLRDDGAAEGGGAFPPCRFGSPVPVQESIRWWRGQDHELASPVPRHGIDRRLPVAADMGVPIVQIDPFEWVKAPRCFCGGLPGTGDPCLAPELRLQPYGGPRPRRGPGESPSRALRMVINCSEPVRQDGHREFVRRFSPFGMRKDALGVCYAMAGTTFAVTQTSPGKSANVVCVSGKARPGAVSIDPCRHPGGTKYASPGRAINGCELKVIDEERNGLPEGRSASSPSVPSRSSTATGTSRKRPTRS